MTLWQKYLHSTKCTEKWIGGGNQRIWLLTRAAWDCFLVLASSYRVESNSSPSLLISRCQSYATSTRTCEYELENVYPPSPYRFVSLNLCASCLLCCSISPTPLSHSLSLSLSPTSRRAHSQQYISAFCRLIYAPFPGCTVPSSRSFIIISLTHSIYGNTREDSKAGYHWIGW